MSREFLRIRSKLVRFLEKMWCEEESFFIDSFHSIRFIVIFLARKGNVNVSFLDLAKDESESLSILILLACNKCKDRAKLSLDVRKDPPLPLKIIIQLLVVMRS